MTGSLSLCLTCYAHYVQTIAKGCTLLVHRFRTNCYLHNPSNVHFSSHPSHLANNKRYLTFFRKGWKRLGNIFFKGFIKGHCERNTTFAFYLALCLDIITLY